MFAINSDRYIFKIDQASINSKEEYRVNTKYIYYIINCHQQIAILSHLILMSPARFTRSIMSSRKDYSHLKDTFTKTENDTEL